MKDQVDYNPKAWEKKKLDKTYERVGWSTNRLHTMELLNEYHENDFLDIGCLDGAYIKRLRTKHGYTGKYHGIDITERHIKLAQINVPDETFRIGDARDLNFKDKSFNTILFSDVIQHLPDPKPPIDEVCRVARKYVILSTYGSTRETFTHHRSTPNFNYKKEDIIKLIPENFSVIKFDILPHPTAPTSQIHHYVLQRLRI